MDLNLCAQDVALMMEVTSPSCLLFVEKAIMNCIVEIKNIDKGFIDSALNDGREAHSFTIISILSPARTILSLLLGPPALVNVSFLAPTA